MSSQIVNLVTLDTPTTNGRIYPKDVMENAIAEYMARSVNYASVLYTSEIDPLAQPLDRITHQVNRLFIEDGKVKAELTLMPKLPFSSIVENCHVRFTPVGVGTMSEDGTIGADYKLSYIAIIPEVQNND